jgi:transposase
MTLMTVNNHEQGKDHRSQPCWSAGKKMDAVQRLLRGESLEELSRELKVEAHRLAAWRDDFLAAGKQGLKGQRADRPPDDRALNQAERKIGQLTMENEVLRAAAEKGGCRSRRRSGPDSRGTQASASDGVPPARRIPLDRLRPSGRCGRTPGTARAGNLDQRCGAGQADPPGARGLAVRR